MMYPSQDPYPSQQPPSGGEPYSSYTPPSEAGSYPPPPQGPYTPMPGAGPYQYPPQGPYTPQQPGSGPYPYPPQQGPYVPPQQPGAGPYPYPPQQQGYYAPPMGAISNSRANNAMIYGFISFALGAITLATSFGYAGIITGTFAIFYGFTGLNIAKRLPNNAGRTQAIIGIVLGFVALFIVVLSFIIRSAMYY